MAVDRSLARRWLQEALQLEPGDRPFPWQSRLFEAFLAGDRVEALDLPTGLGKTSTMAIWLVARACGADLPRRLVYVVDRRVVVDQATRVAEGLRKVVDADGELKRALGFESSSLPISTLRGQFVDNRLWMDAPELPAILVGTVDMIGSRLLFEGYGTRRQIRPCQTGLMASDAMVLLDEAHLAYPFLRLLRRIETGDGLRATEPTLRALLPRFRCIALSATVKTGGDAVFGLDKEDRAHPVVSKRLTAGKRLTARHLAGGEKLAEALAEEAWSMGNDGGAPRRVLIFSDSREVARAALEALRKLAKKTELRTELLVGERRIYEREAVAQNLQAMGFLSGSTEPSTVPCFVFATAAGEVGVDLDADHLVCDLVEHERMVQRFGRVNRRGEKKSMVRVIVDSKAIAEIEKTRVADGALRNLLQAYLQEDEQGQVSPNALAALARDPNRRPALEAATTPEPLRPELSRGLLDTWALTSLEENPGRPEVQPWLRGWEKETEPPATSILFRAHLPIREGLSLKPADVEGYLEAAPPHASERLEAPTHRVLKWLQARVESFATKRADEGPRELPTPLALVLSERGDFERVLVAADLDQKRDYVEAVLKRRILVVDAALGGLTDGLLDPSADAPPPTADQEELGFPVGFRVRRVAPDSLEIESPWRMVWSISSRISPDGEPAELLVVEARDVESSSEDARSASQAQLLAEHQAWTADDARLIARRVGLPAPYEAMLVCAARLHDEGKRASRWQRAFNAGSDGVYAKTRGPISPAVLGGYRHELGSLPRALDDSELRSLDEELRELALHLIAAHHGNARPVLSIDGFDDLPPSRARELQSEVALRFARLQRRWGSWGLAWWEALLRAADVRASRRNEEVR